MRVDFDMECPNKNFQISMKSAEADHIGGSGKQ